MGFFECYLGWVLFVTTLIIIWLWRKFVTKTDREAALRKRVLEVIKRDPPWCLGSHHNWRK